MQELEEVVVALALFLDQEVVEENRKEGPKTHISKQGKVVKEEEVDFPNSEERASVEDSPEAVSEAAEARGEDSGSVYGREDDVEGKEAL